MNENESVFPPFSAAVTFDNNRIIQLPAQKQQKRDATTKRQATIPIDDPVCRKYSRVLHFRNFRRCWQHSGMWCMGIKIKTITCISPPPVFQPSSEAGDRLGNKRKEKKTTPKKDYMYHQPITSYYCHRASHTHKFLTCKSQRERERCGFSWESGTHTLLSLGLKSIVT